MGDFVLWKWIETKLGLQRLLDSLCMKLVWVLPERLVYWCAMRVGAHATTGKWGTQVVADLGFMDAIRRWGEPNE